MSARARAVRTAAAAVAAREAVGYRRAEGKWTSQRAERSSTLLLRRRMAPLPVR